MGLALAGLGAGAASARAGDSWQLDVRFYDPQRISLRLPGDVQETTFWYLLYEVTNRTGKDVDFYPSIRLITSTLEVVEAGANIHPMVYDAVAARHRNEFPFLAPPAKITGRLLQGRENARASVAIFRTFDPEASSFTVFAAGFSGELRRVTNPAFDAKGSVSDKNPRAFLLRRTLGIVYDLPGDARTRHLATPIRRTRKWVMR